ncbi:ABC transporter ATP-binding protein [Jiella avicenniae]|uniref:ABC transporter ATP-binding protein n=1 Tax=Jiella avicenniae TaxID=2907202 RepID=A0A9X1P3Y3_9HYPH|nr:ABC transporter ATP-binding protein [Jiella avicenniae]
MSLLHVSDLTGGYGPIKVLHGVDLTVEEGEVVALVGRNGMGKTTTIKTLTGELPAMSGDIRFDGTSIATVSPNQISRMGVGLVPEGRRCFSNLSVEEHLKLAERSGPGGHYWTRERVFEMFPRLKERRANLAFTLSGGEQQKLAIGRALVTNPKLLILDEATEGLAPLVRKDIWLCLESIAKAGLSVIVVDKNLKALARIAQRVVVISKGRSVWEGAAQAFAEDESLHQQHLGV